ncbi:amino acid permease-like protein [Entomoplasma freundtii]|uniref:Amino acid permease n=1 Tax=Entomoplasma freundtii TaxID=74700 RepID=A0A2K8NTL1_9MOLU|nr:APC family permease [Entomoplasma freundtii]ATZ16091.1 amino acid permease [Entomoplasma freundtii]TDY57008.1 amino acid permease-like protein [Entomoplasma freundtii]
MFKNKAKTYEFLTLFTMVIGTVIGSGIFVKNKQLLEQTGNPIIAIVLWTLVGIVAVMTVYAFMQIASATRNHGNGTVSNWAKLFLGRRCGSLFSLIYAFLYFPICQSVFVSSFIAFLFLAMGIDVSLHIQLIVFIVSGVTLIILIGLINAFSPNASKMIQIFGTVFKFIPLIAALIAGFCLIDKTPGAAGNSSMWNGTGVGVPPHPWSATDFKLGLFIRGFGPILFAFDGFIYVANAQKTAKYKEVVPLSLLAGMIFVAVFYVLMAISLFLGSPDGSIVELLARIFSKNPNVANILSNVILMIICFIGINIFGFLGIMDLESNVDAKLIFFRQGKIMTRKKAAFIQVLCASVVYIVFILLGAIIPRNGWEEGLHSVRGDLDVHTWLQLSTDKIGSFVGTISSTASVLAFMMIATILIGAFVNDYTKKVDVIPIKGFKPVAMIAAILLYLMVIAGLYAFIEPINVYTGNISWVVSDGLYFTIFMTVAMLIIFALWGAQEMLFKKYPFKHGFNGYLSEEKAAEKAKRKKRNR